MQMHNLSTRNVYFSQPLLLVHNDTSTDRSRATPTIDSNACPHCTTSREFIASVALVGCTGSIVKWSQMCQARMKWNHWLEQQDLYRWLLYMLTSNDIILYTVIWMSAIAYPSSEAWNDSKCQQCTFSHCSHSSSNPCCMSRRQLFRY